jgi:hypothetical protein
MCWIFFFSQFPLVGHREFNSDAGGDETEKANLLSAEE